MVMEDTGNSPMDVVGGAASAAFEQALADGLSPADAMGAAGAAAEGAAGDLGIPAEVFGPIMQSAQEGFQDALADGANPQDAFEAAGDAAQGAADPMGAIEGAAEQAFTEAMADGASPADAMQAAADAAEGVAGDFGIPPADFQEVMQPAQDAFMQQVEAGAPVADCIEAAVQSVDDAVDGFDPGMANGDYTNMAEGIPPEGGFDGPPVDGPPVDGDFAALDGALGPADGGGNPMPPPVEPGDAALTQAMDAGIQQGGAPGDGGGADAGPAGIAGDFVDPGAGDDEAEGHEHGGDPVDVA